MGVTLEFYSAEPEAFVSILEKWFAAETEEEEVQLADELHARYLRADFSLHLYWPEDIDALCQAMSAGGLNIPGSCADLLVEELWFDGYSAWVDRLSQTLPLAMAHLSDAIIERIAKGWVGNHIPDPNADPVYYANAFDAAVRALWDLRMVSQDALERGRDVLLFRLW